MQYLNHNFYKNFSGSVNAGDTEYSLDIFINELGDLITYHSDKVFELFGKTGIDVSKKVSDEAVVDAILRHTYADKKNPKLIKGIGFLIAEQNEILTSKLHDNLIKKQLDAISTAVNRLFTYIHSNEGLKKEFKDEVLNSVLVKSKNVPERTRLLKTNKNNIWIGLLIFAGIGVIAFLLWKYAGKKQDLLATGGAVEGVNPVPEVPVASPDGKTPVVAKAGASTVVTTTTVQPNEFGNLPDGAPETV